MGKLSVEWQVVFLLGIYNEEEIGFYRVTSFNRRNASIPPETDSSCAG